MALLRCMRPASLNRSAVGPHPQSHRDRFKRKSSRGRLSTIDSKVGSTMSDEELKTELERLRNENAALKKGRHQASA